MKTLLDNHPEKLADYLREHLGDCDAFRLVSAYFSIHGYKALAKELQTPKDIRFLLGEPESVKTIGDQNRPDMLATISEAGLSFDPSDFWRQKSLAEECAKWIQDNVSLRSMKESNFLHGKMYHMQTSAGSAATVGSSNFTSRGLGASPSSNLEINIAIEDGESRDELAEWFDELWNDEKRTKDVKEDVLAALGHYCQDHDPDFVYYKTLYEIFRDEIEKRKNMDETSDAGVAYKDTQIWNALYEFQKDGVKGIIHRLREYNGCILADSVGLGKTFTALAVIKHFKMCDSNAEVLVLCPKKLRENWKFYRGTARASNPLAEDNISYDLLSHTDLGRTERGVEDIDFSDFDWGKYDLVVIDESHNFRNDTKSHRKADKERGVYVDIDSRYQHLVDDVILGGNKKTKVLMLSATPVNNSLLDLRNQINLMSAGSEHAFGESLKVGNIKSLFAKAERNFKKWEAKNKNVKQKNRAELLESLGGDFQHILGEVTIARSRRQIKRFYESFIKEQGDFPKRKVESATPHTDTKGELKYEKLIDQLKQVKFSIYSPSQHIKNPKVSARLAAEEKHAGFTQEGREQYLVGMMRVNFMKRLESSAHALKLTLQRTIGKIDEQVASIHKFKQTQEDSNTQVVGKDEDVLQEESEEFEINRKALNPFHLKDLWVDKWQKFLESDRKVLQGLLDEVTQITPERDNKLQEFKKRLYQKSKKKNKKILVFTAFKDTAKYLYDNIAEDAAKAGMPAAMVAGDETHTQKGKNGYLDILNNFSPKARKIQQHKADEEIHLLIATDCISEGQNLHDGDMVLNYDIHWNPVRLIQRFGRIDRIGSKNPEVRMLNFWPTENMEYYLKLEARVQARMALVDATTTLDNSLEDEIQESVEEAEKKLGQGEFNFRDAKLLTDLHNNKMVDLEEANSVSISDFALEHFLRQLLRYLEKNPNRLKEDLAGIHAVVKAADAKLPQAGAIFLLRHTNPPEDRGGNALHPHYLVHVNKDGKAHARYTQAQNTLNVLSDLADGKESDSNLCRALDRIIEEQDGGFYSKIAQDALDNIQETSRTATMNSVVMGARRGVKLPRKSESASKTNLHLVTWFAIMGEQK